MLAARTASSDKYDCGKREDDRADFHKHEHGNGL
jgi:hypothetical protein